MKIIIVDDQKSKSVVSRCEHNGLSFEPILLSPHNQLSAYQIAQLVNEAADDSGNIIFLNAKIKYTPGAHPWYGVEILKEIRANRFFDNASKIQTSHIVFFSPLSMHRFINIDSETFFIAISPRVTFLRYTDDFSKLNVAKLAAETLTNLQVLVPYFHSHLLGSENRHSSANVWAAGQFFRQYEVVKPGCSSTYLSELNSTKTALLRDANFVYNITHTPLCPSDKKSLSKSMVGMRRQLLTENRQGFKQRKKIALIDDQAFKLHNGLNWGWQAIYSLLFFGDKEGVIPIDAQATDEDILRQIDYSFDCILLDLHFDSHDHEVNARKIRGAVLMKKIQQRYPFLPVIITTASNKARKRKILLSVGCDAYWIKEGFDEPMSRIESFQNYLHLLELVTKVSTKEYCFLKKCAIRLRAFRKTTLWWEHYRWPNKNESPASLLMANKREVMELLEHALLIIRTYLQHKMIGEGFYPKKKNGMELRGLIVQLTLILEMFHSPKGAFYSDLLYQHQDTKGKELYRLRNQAAHKTSGRKTTYKDFCIFFEKFLDYLTYPPLTEQNQKIPQVA